MYEGSYVRGLKEGHGKYTWADGTTYEGEWINNQVNGYGIYREKGGAGKRYYGQWRKGDMHGFGVEIKKDGRVYVGFFE